MKRYERQIILPEIGITGQQKLAEARVLIIGMGGLGCPVLQNLAAAGVGTIGIVDGDVVDETNLHRQYLYTPTDIGKSKVVVAAEAVAKQNPNVEIISYPDYLSKHNCIDVVFDYKIIVDCSDNIAARYLINDVAVVKRIPMVYASIHKFEGQLSVFNYNNGSTYRCLFPENEQLETIPNCNDSGVLGVMSNVLGVMQANEVLKIILGIGEVLSGKMLLYNSLDNGFQDIEIQKNTNFNNKFKLVDRSVNGFDFLADDNSFIIDIRENYEEPKLDLENVKNVPLSELDNFLKDIDKSQKIILICQHGNRSGLAVDYLNKQGFTSVFHLQNGVESIEKKLMTTDKPKKSTFIQGAIAAEFIGNSIAKHQSKTSIGAHNIFLGQVRADEIDGKSVVAIDYSAYEEMAEQVFYEIREAAFEKYDLTCLHIYHSLGLVKSGEICLFVFVSAPRRKVVFEALEFLVEEIKEKVPVFGKEIFEDETYTWKKNT